jgi:hypothetical protein
MITFLRAALGGNVGKYESEIACGYRMNKKSRDHEGASLAVDGITGISGGSLTVCG